MTLQQQAINVMERLPEDKLSQVIQFAEFLASRSNGDIDTGRNNGQKDQPLRKPGILKRKMVMAEDFDETPDCFKEYM